MTGDTRPVPGPGPDRDGRDGGDGRDATEPGRPSLARRATVAVAALAAVLAVAVGVLLVVGPGGDGTGGTGAPAAPTSAAPPSTGVAAPTSAPPSAGPGTTAAAPSAASSATAARPTATALPPAPPDAVTAVWPVATGDVRYADPVAAARGFAVELVGFRAPVLGPFRQGDARSGEVEVRPEAGGPVTTVFVRMLGDGTWWALGSATEGIELDSPTAGDVLTSPAVLTGRAVAFEGQVTVRIVEDGGGAPLATGFVTGGGDEPRPFEGSFPLRAPSAGHGAVLLTTESARDGQVWTAAVVRVGLAPAG